MCLNSPSNGGWWFIPHFLAFLSLLKWDRLTIWLFYHQIPDKRLQRVDDQATSFKTKQYKVWNDNCLFWIAEELSRGRQKSNIRGPWYDVHVWYVRTKRCWVSQCTLCIPDHHVELPLGAEQVILYCQNPGMMRHNCSHGKIQNVIAAPDPHLLRAILYWSGHYQIHIIEGL